MFSVSLSIFFCLDRDNFLIFVCGDLGRNMDRWEPPSTGGRARGGAGGRGKETREEKEEEEEAREATHAYRMSISMHLWCVSLWHYTKHTCVWHIAALSLSLCLSYSLSLTLWHCRAAVWHSARVCRRSRVLVWLPLNGANFHHSKQTVDIWGKC